MAPIGNRVCQFLAKSIASFIWSQCEKLIICEHGRPLLLKRALKITGLRQKGSSIPHLGGFTEVCVVLAEGCQARSESFAYPEWYAPAATAPLKVSALRHITDTTRSELRKTYSSTFFFFLRVKMRSESDRTTSAETIALLAKRVNDLVVKYSSQPSRRILIALAGIPGSGKSTVSKALLESLRCKAIDDVVLVPMVRHLKIYGKFPGNDELQDGFHFPKMTLAKFPCPETAFRRRGAPFTFDADAFVEVVASLKQCPVTQVDDPELAILLPGFDHAVQDPVHDEIYVPSSARVVIVEGNYLLFDESPWSKALAMFDEKYDASVIASFQLTQCRWFVDVSCEVAKWRLIERHLRAGIETDREAAALRVEENDIENGKLIKSKLVQPDVVIMN